MATITLQQIGQIALQSGLDSEGARVAMAIAQTERGLSGAVGDSGQSFGPFQFYTGGQLSAFAQALGTTLQQAAQYATTYPEIAAQWALSGYLGDAIRAGQGRGLSGADLATYAQTNGQGSETPWAAGNQYNQLFAGQADDGTLAAYRAQQGLFGGPGTPQTGGGGTNVTDVTDQVDLTPEEIAQLLQSVSGQQGGGGPTTPGGYPINVYDDGGSGILNQGTSALAAQSQTGAGLTIAQIEQWTGKKVASVTSEPSYIDVPDPEYGGLTTKKVLNPDKSTTRITFSDGSYMVGREGAGPGGEKTYGVTNSGDAFKPPPASSTSTASTSLARAQLAWDAAKSAIDQKYKDRQITLEEAKAEADLAHQKIQDMFTQRGQDITLRGQNLSTAAQLGGMAQSAVEQDLPNLVPKGTSEDLGKLAAAWKNGGVADVTPRPVQLDFNPATVGMQVAAQILGMPAPSTPYSPNTFQAPSIVLGNGPAGVNMGGLPQTILPPKIQVTPPLTATSPEAVIPPGYVGEQQYPGGQIPRGTPVAPPVLVARPGRPVAS